MMVRSRHCFAFCTALVLSSVAQAASVLQNGDFSLGNVAFGTDYTLGVAHISGEAMYIVGTNPRLYHYATGTDYGDHTTGDGLMMLVNGAMTPGKAVWTQTVNVLPNTEYDFTGWVSSWGGIVGTTDDPSPANLQLYINGIVAGDAYLAPATMGEWGRFSRKWDSGVSTTAILRLVDLNTEPIGNDFAIDDLSFQVATPQLVPLPSAIWMAAVLLAGVGIGRAARR